MFKKVVGMVIILIIIILSIVFLDFYFKSDRFVVDNRETIKIEKIIK